MASLVITVKTSRVQANLKQELELSPTQKRGGILAIGRYMRALASGMTRGIVSVQTASTDPVAASGTATLTSVVAGNTLTIAGTTLTASATPTGAAQFQSAGSNTVVAAALAACINANPTLNQLVSASSALGVVTIVALQAGIIGNLVSLVASGSPIVVSAATLASGAGGAQEVATVYQAY